LKISPLSKDRSTKIRFSTDLTAVKSEQKRGELKALPC
jgi:hypothetical protein